jgi:peptidoglycan hydrolase CwlO-like protein|tara:strand:+ start:43 stop:303 length:261 start_codon:yes stop_codon:yes gene_type:complete
MTTLNIILIIALTIVITTSFFIIRNLIIKNETLEDFISKQSEAIEACDQRLKQIDDKGMFYADDQIGFFFKEVQKIQEALNEFTLK